VKAPAARTVVITGVTSGLGRALVDALAGAGHTVAGCGRTASTIDELRRLLGAPHDFAVVDVAREPEVALWAERLVEHDLVPDLLVNNAALMNEPAPLWEVPAEQFSALIDVNVKGVAAVIRHLAPVMIARRRGVIVNLSSGWGRSVDAEVAPYCASKWAIEGLTRSVALELPPGMAAVALNPGVIDTPMLRRCFGDSAAHYPDPASWARRAAPYMLSLGREHNGRSLTVAG
jgi:NAD(P)-dependent dehydrogenase (short-subunit alcohol dehydrogenase family)